MREDQYLKLQALEEKLTDQLLFEADPQHWPGNGLTAMEMTQQQRGDRYWSKKNAVATLSLTMRVGSLIGAVQVRDPAGPPPDGEEGDPGEGLLDAEIAAAEKEAAALLKRMEKATAPGQ